MIELQTPKSDAAIARFDDYTSGVKHRLENGRRDYGDSSFETPLERMITEIQQELMDVTGWSFILHERLETLRNQLRVLSVLPQSQPEPSPHPVTTYENDPLPSKNTGTFTYAASLDALTTAK